MELKAALYIRVSTAHQVDKYSLPFQKSELINYAKHVLNISDYHIFEDAGFSAGNTNRPAYKEMMGRIQDGEFTHLLVWKLDRISRNLKDFVDMYEDLAAHDIKLISKMEQFDTTTIIGEAMLKMALIFAEMERLLTKERVTENVMARAARGEWYGGSAPYGFTKTEEVPYPVPVADEVETVQYIFNLYEKVKSTGEVSFQLNEQNIKTKKGGKWTEKTVRDILRRDFYIGTYSYNKRKSGSSRRLKDKSEWIVIPDNHPAIISKEQFERVNKMLNDNYRGRLDVQRANIHTHMFSKKLYCSNCGELLSAGLDTPRKDGYRPSRYTCSTNRKVRNIHSCNSFISDIGIAPFVLNYIANMIRLHDKANLGTNRSLTDIKRMLLRGNAFIDVKDINKDALKEVYIASLSDSEKEVYSLNNGEVSNDNSLALSRLKKEKSKYNKALERLEDLYLFDDEGISKKDYILRKKKITAKLDDIEDESRQLLSESGVSIDHSFLNDAKQFLMSQALLKSRDIDYRYLLDTIGVEEIADFIDSTVSKIIIEDKLVKSIIFNNGITHTFIYRPKEKRSKNHRQRGLYKEYRYVLLDHIKEHGPVKRVDVEKLTGLGRHGATTLINDLLSSEDLIRKGNSNAVQYFLNDEKKH